ncbi:M14 family zinc carboxypeptidase [Vreelandella alkaliphila]|uniref:DUF2817 domain-containing protein n=1 Tax=Vreelandella alkaliphila TaxID=272774 RepID=A0A7C9K621_9GAMM|nr:M14 family zinc carboxypeptidase [Halomonas alkaliphila]NDL70501.1 DUF2817 domain-containing protein [Halomonas alkaliphila]
MALPPFDPASEPLGSTDPRVRAFNSKLLDEGMHSKEDKFIDRFGEEKMTWYAMENERVGLLIAGGQIFETEAEGRAAAEDGQYFFAASADPDVSKTLYKRISESESQWIADDPSAELVRRMMLGDIDFSALPTLDEDVADGGTWVDRRAVSVKREYPEIWGLSHSDAFPTTQSVFDYLDALMAEFSQYVSKTLLGNDVLGGDIYRYNFRPADYYAEDRGNGGSYPQNDVELPLVVMTCSMHGDERHTTKAAVHFVEDLCRGWKNDKRLQNLRWGCEFALIPVLNPTGYDTDTRRNFADVDINRNFPAGWLEGGIYRGSEPLSEPESQALASYIVDEQYRLTAYIDNHRVRAGREDRPYSIWIGANGESAVGLAGDCVNHMIGYARRHISNVPQSNEPMGKLADLGPAQATLYVNDDVGVSSYLLETPPTLWGADTLLVYRHAVEAITALVWSVWDAETDNRRLEYRSEIGALQQKTSLLMNEAVGPSRQDKEFYFGNDDIESYFAVVNADWDILFDLPENQQFYREFYFDNEMISDAFVFVDADGYMLLDSGGDQEFYREFYFGNDDIESYFTVVNADGYVLLDPQSGSSPPDIDFSNLPSSYQGLDKGDPWLTNGVVHIEPQWPPYFMDTGRALFPGSDAVYAAFDALQGALPDYITSDVVGMSTLGKEIRAYRLSPPPFYSHSEYTDEDLEYPKIVLCSAIHGNEKEALLTLYHFVESVCLRWRESDFLHMFRWGVEIIILPCCNPDGVDQTLRRNANNVDLNRNFPYNWNESESGAGPSAGSEIETQLLMQVPALYPGALLYLDIHEHVNSNFFGWFSFNTVEDFSVFKPYARYLDGLCKRFNTHDDDANTSRIRVTGLQYGRMRSYWQNEYGVTGALWERNRHPQSIGAGSSIFQSHQFNALSLRAMLKAFSEQEIKEITL